MAHFVFKARRSSGEVYNSERDAEDRYQLYRLVRESGDEVISLTEKSSLKGNIRLPTFGLGGHVRTVDVINFARNTGSMLEAGLALSRVLSVLERQSHSKRLKVILSDLIEEVGRGTAFSDALAKYPKVFSELFVSMVRAGEQGGTLAESLKIVAMQMDRTHNLERRVKGALIYPGVILFVMIVIAILMLTFVVPTLMQTFTELNVPLPLTTRIVLGVSVAMQSYGVLILLALVVIAFGLYWWSRRPSGKNIIHMALLKIPIIGGLVQEVNTARTSRTLSSLLSSGVDVVEAVKITSMVVQNVHFRKVLTKTGEAIKTGEPMSKTFEGDSRLYPVFFAEMISVGEETGKIGEMLLGVAKYYEEDVEQKTKDMSTIIEPFLMVIIAVAVGFFAVSMISPMYSLVDAI